MINRKIVSLRLNMGEFGNQRTYIPPLIFQADESRFATMSSGRCDGQDRYSMKIAVLSDHATIPTLASQFAAGYDLYSAYDYDVLPLSRQLCKTDIAVIVPTFTYGRIAPKSGLALHHGIDVFAGVIDEDYRGNVGVLLYNTSLWDTFRVRRGMAIAQLICECVKQPCIRVIDASQLSDRTELNMRMDAAWGSGISADRDREETPVSRYLIRDSTEFNAIENRWNQPTTSRWRHPETGEYVGVRGPQGSTFLRRRLFRGNDIDSSNDDRHDVSSNDSSD